MKRIIQSKHIFLLEDTLRDFKSLKDSVRGNCGGESQKLPSQKCVNLHVKYSCIEWNYNKWFFNGLGFEVFFMRSVFWGKHQLLFVWKITWMFFMAILKNRQRKHKLILVNVVEFYSTFEHFLPFSATKYSRSAWRKDLKKITSEVSCAMSLSLCSSLSAIVSNQVSL